MARLARVVAPGYPHHIVQRGNRRQKTFFYETDYSTYIDILSQECTKHHLEILAWCLMPNHVHLIAVPHAKESMAKAIGECHRRYSSMINNRQKWQGHLWQERFASFPLEDSYLLAAVRYVEMNPVAAGIVQRPEDYRWSSARAHLNAINDRLINVDPLLEIVDDWCNLLRLSTDLEVNQFHSHERSGRPLGEDRFITKLELLLGRSLHLKKPGPKKGAGR